MIDFKTSTQLLNLVKANNREAWEKFVDLYGPMIYHWCRELGVGPEDSADLTQEIFVELTLKLNQYRRSKQHKFRSWLKTITIRRVIDFRRKNDPVAGVGGTNVELMEQQIADQEKVPDDGHEQEAEVVEPIAELVQAAINSVRRTSSEKSWEAFRMTTLGGMNATEAAKALDMTPDAVRQAKKRVKKRLESFLQSQLA